MGWLLAGAGAILLLISLFLDWYEPALTGWTVFEALDLVLAAAALTVLAVAARAFGFGAVGETAGTAAAVAAFVVVVSQLINHPPAATGADIDIGGWLALAAALLMVVGALMSRTGVSVAVVLEGSGSAPQPRGGTTSPASGAGEGQTVPMPPEESR